MKLTELEKQVVGAVCFRGEVSVPELAKELKQREHKVRYALDRLLETQVITPHFYLCPAALGFTEYQLFVSLAKHGAAAREKFITTVRNCGQVSWLCAVGGPFEFDVTLCARSVQELSAFLETLSGVLKSVELRKVVAVQLDMIYYAPKYLGLSRFAVPSLEYGMSPAASHLDALDYKILNELTQGNGLPYSQMARRLGMGLTTLLYRIKSYKEHGILKGVGYFINALNVGVQPYIFLVQLTRSGQAMRKSVQAFCAKHPNVTFLIENLGGWDYQIGARFEEHRHVTGFVDEVQQEFEGVLGDLTCVPVFEPLRLEWNPFAADGSPAAAG